MGFLPDAPPKLSFVPDKVIPGNIDSAMQGLGGFAPDTPSAPSAADQEQHPVQDVIDMIRAAPSGVIPALKGMLGQMTDPYGSVLRLAQSVKSVIANPDTALAAVRNATPQQVGKNVLGPALVGAGANALGGAAAGLADTTGAAAAEAATPAGQLGLRSTQGRPVATTLAGPTAAPTLDAQNQAVAHTVLGADVGVPHGLPVNPENLAKAREVPGKVLDEGAASLPTAPLSDAAAQQVLATRPTDTITKPTPNVSTAIQGIEDSLLQPGAQFSGKQIRATRNSLSSDADAGMNSDDADTRAIAKYKRGVVNALDQHIADTMPANSAISPDMIATARTTLAKNYSLQDLIGKGGDVNLQQLAKLHRDNPNLLTGNTRTVAEFANQHPEVTGGITDANRVSPPGLDTDLAHINLLNPRSWIQPLFGHFARNSLESGNPLGLAKQAPVMGAAGEFEHQPFALGAPPGQAFEPHQPQAATATPQRDFFGTGANDYTLGPGGPEGPTRGAVVNPNPNPLDEGDLLSQLSAGPMGAPAHGGLPFNVPPDSVGLRPLRSGRQISEPAPTHMIGLEGEPVETGMGGGPQLGDRHTLQDLLEQLSDHPAVMHQNRSLGVSGSPATKLGTTGGVPEDIMTHLENNASGESSASMEAINRTKREQAQGQDRFLIDPDGRMWPVRGVEAADATAPKGSIIVQKGVGGTPYSILDRGGLPHAHANGLLNRALAGGQGLNLMDLLSGDGG